MKKNNILLVLIFVFALSSLIAQTYTLNSTTNGTTVTTCSGTFVDQGGTSGNYSNNSDYTITFCSGSSQVININFTVLSVESGWDHLTVYDGSSTSSPILDDITGNIGAYILQSSGSCMTFHFTSDGSTRDLGWQGTISCVTPCITPIAGGVFTNQSSPVKVCLNETIGFSGASSSAGTGFTISNFVWDFDDGSTGSGVNVNHAYTNPGRYIVQLKVTDNNGCTNNNFIDLVVEVGTIPNFNGTTADQSVCVNDPACITGVVNPTTWQDIPPTSVADPSPLPDGSGICYEVPLTFNQFTPGTTITSASQIQNVFANIVHSWAGDLSINLICPNNQTLGLFNSDGTWNTTNISSENFGNPTTNSGFNYTWVTTGTTMDAWGAANPTATTIPAGTYGSEQQFSSLIGCPVNGTWILEVCDLHSIDAGTVFSWGITFNPTLYANLSNITPVYNTNCTDNSWTGTNASNNSLITSTSANCNQICVTPTSSGTFDYIYSVTDDFGCSFDTTISVTAAPCVCTVSASNSGAVCAGANIDLFSTSVAGATAISWSGPNGFNSNIQNPLSITAPNIQGTYTYSVVITTPAGNCNATTNVSVYPIPLLTPITSQIHCSNEQIDPITFTSSVNGSTVAWTGNPTATTIGLSPSSGIGNINSFIGINSTTSALTGIITATPTANGCTGSPITFSITVNPVPVLSVISNQNFCAGQLTSEITFSPATLDSVSWTNTQTGIGLAAYGLNSIPSFTSTNSNSTSLSGTIVATPFLNGCEGAPKTFSITINPIPVLNSINNQTVCSGENTTLVGFTSSVNGTTVNWTNNQTGTGLVANGSGDIPSFTGINSSSSPITSTITATPTVNSCIGQPQIFTITVNNQISPDFIQVPAVCDGAVLNPLPTTSTNSINGTWSPAINNSSTTTYIFTPAVGQCATTAVMTIAVGSNVLPLFDQVQPICSGDNLTSLPTISTNGLTGSWSPTITNTVTTTYSFTPLPNQCALTAQMTIQVNNPVTPQFTVVNPYCAGSLIDPLPQTSTNGINGQWQPAVNNFTTTTYSFSPTAGVCATNATMQIVIYPKPSLSDISLTNETCSSSNGVITINNVNGGTSPYEYSLNNAQFVSSNSFIGLDSGSYFIIVRDANSCSDTLTTNITNYPGPTGAQFSTTNADCGIATGSISVDGISGGTTPYQYNFNNTGFTSTPTIGQLNTGNFSVIIKDANGCILDSIIRINGLSQVNADFTITPQSGIVPVLASFTNTSSTPTAQFSWNLGLSSVDTIAFQPNAQIYDVYGIYTITQIATNGNQACNDTMVKLLYVELNPFISVPNIFSPNGDGNNEEFFIQSRGYIDLKVTIFNRWGNIINSFDGVLGSWDGKDTGGNKVSEGTYYYFISGKRFDSEPFEAHGFMMLVR